MKRLFHFLSLSFIFMLSSMAVCGCVPAQTPLYYFHAGLSTYHELLDDVLGKRSEVDLFSSAADSSAPVSSVTETISCAPLYADYSYYLPSLADDEAANFQALYTGIQGFQSTISLPVAVSSDNVSDLMHLLTNECPELMQLSSRWVEHSNLLYLYHLSTQYQRKLLMRRQQLLIHLFKVGRQHCRDKVLIRLSLLFTIISLKTVYILLRQTIARVPMVL